MIRVCFVCLGNICRSPTAEGVMLHLVRKRGLDDQIAVESAGTSGYHAGEPADPRTQATARERGIELTSRARQFDASDFQRCDYVVAMDRENLRNLERLAPSVADRGKLYLLRAFDSSSGSDLGVPDPYYGGPRGFDNVFDICMAGCQGLLDHIVRTHALKEA